MRFPPNPPLQVGLLVGNEANHSSPISIQEETLKMTAKKAREVKVQEMGQVTNKAPTWWVS